MANTNCFQEEYLLIYSSTFSTGINIIRVFSLARAVILLWRRPKHQVNDIAQESSSPK
ncbi:hypothetical protein [Runella slithyformis]|uniref:hypothetical protein n=1 Tax=Runella slithyformis TaxID=106 RepID=UPI00286D77EA|nr:hypothetical protein [Runella slithyformis]